MASVSALAYCRYRVVAFGRLLSRDAADAWGPRFAGWVVAGSLVGFAIAAGYRRNRAARAGFGCRRVQGLVQWSQCVSGGRRIRLE